MINKVVIITRYRNRILCLKLSDNRPEDIAIYTDSEIHLGNIYIGRVKNIVKNIGAAFIEVAPGRICYFPLKEMKELNNLSREGQDRLCQGDNVVVQISKDAVRSKEPVCSGRLSIDSKLRKELIEKAKSRPAFTVLYSSRSEYIDFLAKLQGDYDRIVCDEEDLWEEVDAYLEELDPDRRNCLELYQDEYSLSALYKLDTITDSLLQKTVHLKSGANIVIEYTEALYVIDVNTAKAIRQNDQDYILSINKEAALEAANQIRLRNLSGIILIDFINDNEENTERLVEYIKALCDDKRLRLNYIDMTELGIAEFTRRKDHRTLWESLNDK